MDFAGTSSVVTNASLTFEQAAQRLMQHCAEMQDASVAKFVLTTGMASLEAAFDIPGFQPTMVRQRLALEVMRLVMAQDALENLDAKGLKSLSEKLRKAVTGLAPNAAPADSLAWQGVPAMAQS